MLRLCHQINYYDLGRTYYEMTITEITEIIDNKIKKNKAQYDFDKQTAKISALSSGYVS